MNFCVVVSVFCFSSLVSALPVGQNGMVFFHMPYYNPYQTMLMHHYMPQSRSASTSAFASGDAVAAGTIIRENRVQSDATRAYNQQESASTNDGNVEAIAEAYPEEPIQGAVQFDQSEEQYNEVVPLNAAPVSEEPKEAAEILPQEPKIPLAVAPEPQIQPTAAPKKKVHIALDIPDSNSQTQDEADSDEDDDSPAYAAQKPSRNSAPVYTYFPVSFGRAAGGTIAVANALSMGKGAVRSHAIAYGASGASRRQPTAERHVSAAQKTA